MRYREERTNMFLSMKNVCIMSVILFAATVNADVDVFEANDTVAIENEIVKFIYDLSRGSYDAVDKRTNAMCIKNGYVQINDVTTLMPGFVHTFKSRQVSDELGKGKVLSIQCSKAGSPSLLFEVTLYQEKSCIVFQGGIENATSEPVQLKVIKPIADATLFDGFDMKTNFRMLDGNSGGEPLEWGVKKYTAVYKGNYVSTRNNVLITFGENETRRSMVMGGLTYHDFEKFAVVSQSRRLELAAGPGGSGLLVCYLNLPSQKIDTGTDGASLRLIKGQTVKNFSYKALWGEEIASASSGKEGVILEASGLEKTGMYYLGFSWWHTDRKVERIQSVTVDSGAGTKNYVLVKDKTVPAWNWREKEDPQQVELPIPAQAVGSGILRIRFEGGTDEAPPVVSEVWLRKGDVSLLTDRLTPVNDTSRPRHRLTGQLSAQDPVGKRVDPGVRYLPDDRFYVDFITDNPFENLEQYGWRIRLAQRIELNMYDFPTVCLWYAHHQGYGGGMATNDTVGAVAEMEAIRKAGFLKYSRVAVRLVPDCYAKNNQQGWWDDHHFQMHGSTNLGDFEGGTYKIPYETSEKWGKAITERGGIPLTYCQTGFRSEDYAHAFPEHMLFNKSIAWMNESNKRPLDDDDFWGNAWTKSFRVWSFDYTDPGFVQHVEGVYEQYRSGGIKGLMFDYPARGWAYGGGMEDKYATTSSAYRGIFKLAQDGLGPENYIHERNMERGSDITLGLVTSQRTENDTSRITPQVVTRCGLRWYKNRVVVNYDTDSKNIFRLRDDRDAGRSLMTMSYVTTGRLLLANSFAQMTPEIIQDLTRIFPFHTTPKTARPVDAFTQTYPRIYDFDVSPSWHQLTFFNSDNEKAMDIDVKLAGSTAEGALGLNRDKDYYVYDFWNDTFVGKVAGSGNLSQSLRPGEARMMSVHEAKDHPQFISTNRHIMQGYTDMVKIEWLPGRHILRGISRITGGDSYRVTIATNGYTVRSAHVDDPSTRVKLDSSDNGLSRLILERDGNALVEWTVKF
jgi:hypothetical protein